MTTVDPAQQVRAQTLGPAATIEMDAPIMGAEDFSYVLQRVPGMMAFLGARPPGQALATAPMNHSDLVIFDESAGAAGPRSGVSRGQRLPRVPR